jgi:hypothetical protein
MNFDWHKESKIDIEILAAQQGVLAVSSFDDLLGDFWPEDESADQFIAAVREWRHGGKAVPLRGQPCSDEY